MDINVIRGAVLLLLIVSFLGLWAWAWSSRREEAFHEASMLPLEEDEGEIRTDEARPAGKGSEPC